MASTPEAKVKKAVKDILEEFSKEINVAGRTTSPLRGHPIFTVDTLYQYWPVPSGFGASSLDCLVCYCGVFIAIETKAPGKSPTERQELTIAQIRGASGYALVIDGEQGYQALRDVLRLIRLKDANDRLTKA